MFLTLSNTTACQLIRHVKLKPIIFEILSRNLRPLSVGKQQQKETITITISTLLKKYGLKQSILKTNPWLLNESVNLLQEKLEIIKDIPLKPTNIDLLKLEPKELQSIWENDFERRAKYLQSELNLSYDNATELLKKYKFLRRRSFPKIMEIMQILKSAGIDNVAISEDMWIFNHNEHIMRERVLRIKEYYNCPIKTWMLRCSEDILTNTLRRWSKKVEVLGEKPDLVDYLALRLECDRNTVMSLASRNIRLLTINPPKIKKVLDYLFEQGFTPNHVKLTPRVLNCSLKTIEKRMSDFKERNYFPPTLSVFYYSKEKYPKFIKRLKINEDNSYGQVDSKEKK